MGVVGFLGVVVVVVVDVGVWRGEWRLVSIL